jgi:hypothetical protein
MRRMRSAVLQLLVGLVLSSPGQTAAGPPDRPLGKMVLDKVADGLRRYRMARTPESRIAWLRKLAPIRDARVAVALGESISSDDIDVSRWAIGLVFTHYEAELPEVSGTSPISGMVFGWWKENEADLRRRAKQLPQ